MQRIGKNNGGYFGDVIRIDEVVRDCIAAAKANGWKIETINAKPGLDLMAFTRPALQPTQASPHVYISTGIHGDEPAGPLSALRLLRENRWPEEMSFWFCPCLNPTGFPLNRRENADGVDLNRDYLHTKTAEIRAHTEWLKRQPKFDLSLCLHEDWESNGFYIYELNPDNRPSLAEPMVREIEKVCPIDQAEIIEDRPAKAGIIRPNIDPATRPLWPEAFWLITHKTRLSYTLEAPSDFSLPTRVDAIVTGVKTALKEMAANGK